MFLLNFLKVIRILTFMPHSLTYFTLKFNKESTYFYCVINGKRLINFFL